MGCFAIACFVNHKKKHSKNTRKKFNCNQSFSHRRSYEIQESLKLLAAPTKSIEEKQIVYPCSETETKTKVESERQLTLVDNESDEVEKKKDKEAADSNLPNLTPENHRPEDSNSVEEESSESSLFSLSIDSSWRQTEIGDREVCSPLKPPNDRKTTHSFGSNRTDKRDEKLVVYEEDKENVNLEGMSANLKQSEEDEASRQNCDELIKPLKIDIVDDASLSSWLVEFDKSALCKTSNVNSPPSEKNYGDRQILGALTPQTEQTCS